jgi:hypothetical protein
MRAHVISFPALERHGTATTDTPAQLSTLRELHAMRLSSALRALCAARESASELTALRAYAVATHQLATIERCAARCDLAERVLSSTLSHLLAMAGDRALSPTLRIAAARAAEPCAEDLATLYEDHGLHDHAACARETLALARRSERDALS